MGFWRVSAIRIEGVGEVVVEGKRSRQLRELTEKQS